MAETDVKKCHAQIWSTKYIQNEWILWDALLSAFEEEKVAGKKSATSRTSSCLVTGMSRTCRGRYGEVGIMEFGLYTTPYITRTVCRLGATNEMRWDSEWQGPPRPVTFQVASKHTQRNNLTWLVYSGHFEGVGALFPLLKCRNTTRPKFGELPGWALHHLDACAKVQLMHSSTFQILTFSGVNILDSLCGSTPTARPSATCSKDDREWLFAFPLAPIPIPYQHVYYVVNNDNANPSLPDSVPH